VGLPRGCSQKSSAIEWNEEGMAGLTIRAVVAKKDVNLSGKRIEYLQHKDGCLLIKLAPLL